MRLLRFGLGPAMWKSCVGSHSRRARVAQASNREIPHLSTMAMGSTATSPSRFCTNDGEYDSTPRRGVLFSKRDAAAPGGPNGGLSTGGWAVAEDLSADRTALRTFVSVAGGTLMRTTSSTSGLAPNTGKRSNMLPVPAPPAAPSKAGLQLKQPSIPHDIRAVSLCQVFCCGNFTTCGIIFNFFRRMEDSKRFDYVPISRFFPGFQNPRKNGF